MSAKAFDIQIHKEPRTPRVLRKSLQSITAKILKKLRFKKAALSLVFVGDRKMRKLNKEFLNHDWTTDVISFDLRQGAKVMGNPPLLGEIIISLDTAKKQAKLMKHSLHYEVCFYICHGILHLLGHKDKTQKERARMLNKQEEILSAIGVRRLGAK